MSFAIVAGVGAAATLGGAYISSKAAGNAADEQAAAANKATQMQYDMYQQQRTDQQPWREAGAQALSQLSDPSFNQTFSGVNLQNDPGYQFRMDEGQKALERSAAARGNLQGGATMKALSQYGQDYASNEYQNAYNRFNNDQSNRFNRLSSIAGIGQTANNAIGNAGSNFANSAGNNTMGAANASAAAGMASANQIGGAISGLGNNWMQYQMMSKMPGFGNTSGA